MKPEFPFITQLKQKGPEAQSIATIADSNSNRPLSLKVVFSLILDSSYNQTPVKKGSE